MEKNEEILKEAATSVCGMTKGGTKLEKENLVVEGRGTMTIEGEEEGLQELEKFHGRGGSIGIQEVGKGSQKGCSESKGCSMGGIV